MTKRESADPLRATEAVARRFRPLDDVDLRADLTDLVARRTDLAAVQCAELFKAAIVRLQDRYGVEGRIPPAAAMNAWIDAVDPPAPGVAATPLAGAMPCFPDPKAFGRLTDPASAAIARSLLVLAARRPDLSDLQRDELFLAGLVHLVIAKGGFIIAPTRQRILAWIDLVAPMSRPRVAAEKDRLKPSDAPGPAGPVPSRHRGPGRPGWTPEMFEEHWREAVAATRAPRTFTALALNFRALDGELGGVSGDHLRELRTVRFPETGAISE